MCHDRDYFAVTYLCNTKAPYNLQTLVCNKKFQALQQGYNNYDHIYCSCIIFTFHPPLTRGTGTVSKVKTLAVQVHIKACYPAKRFKNISQLPGDR